MITVVVAVALMIAGLALVFYPDQAIDLVRSVGLPGDVQREVLSLLAEQFVAWAALAAAPLLLIVGSLVRGL
jgi:hypothetical protein